MDYLRGGNGPVYPAGRFYDDAVVYVGILGKLRYARWVYVFSRYSRPSYCEVRSLEYADGLAFYPYFPPSFKDGPASPGPARLTRLSDIYYG